MHIKISTEVVGNYKNILPQFDKTLFLRLSPPGMQVNLIRFDGSKKGDIVQLALRPLGLAFLQQEWTSLITEDGENAEEVWFIDEGQILPSFLAKWKHRHIVSKKSENQSIIIDDIHYESPFLLLDWLLYPVMYLQFYYRKPIYRKFFS